MCEAFQEALCMACDCVYVCVYVCVCVCVCMLVAQLCWTL